MLPPPAPVGSVGEAPVGTSPSNINIYKFNYINSPIIYTGVMAHEVPWASEKHSNGYLMVDYNKIDVDFRRLN